ncbi:MAG: alpha/beta hydrolase [Deltaproteobacteria bacterium]|nr:alpha/beta hydrolase [Deltaproteobacteria bacterium]
MNNFPPVKRIRLSKHQGTRGADIDAIELAVHEAGTGPAVVMCHGFPELAYSWHHQLKAISEGGFRAIVPDMRGYGNSDCPAAIEDYDLEHLTADLVALLDALDIEKAVFAGHDWGGFVAWAMPVLYPDRTLGVIGVNTPNFPVPTTPIYRSLVDEDDKIYNLWFQKPGVAESFLDKRTRMVFEKLMRSGVSPEQAMAQAERDGIDFNPFMNIEAMGLIGEDLLTPEEMDYYIDVYQKAGFRGGINWYRNIDRNAERLPKVGTTKLHLPSLMITAEWDPALTPALAAGMPDICSDLEMHMIEKCGHWTQQEKPIELNRLMLDWLKRRFGKTG